MVESLTVGMRGRSHEKNDNSVFRTLESLDKISREKKCVYCIRSLRRQSVAHKP